MTDHLDSYELIVHEAYDPVTVMDMSVSVDCRGPELDVQSY